MYAKGLSVRHILQNLLLTYISLTIHLIDFTCIPLRPKNMQCQILCSLEKQPVNDYANDNDNDTMTISSILIK